MIRKIKDYLKWDIKDRENAKTLLRKELFKFPPLLTKQYKLVI